MNRILFVDDDSAVLGGLRRTLRAMRGEWELVFAAAGAEALQRCAAQAFDVVVSDAQMPGMAGPDLLKEVMRRQPDSARFVLSGQFRWDLAIRSVGVAHQFWNKPCDPWDLISAAQRVCDLRKHFPDLAARSAVSCVAALPSQPTAYAELVNRVKSARASIEAATEIIARDVALTAKAVHLAGSGFFSGPKHVSSSAAAVNLLGLKTITALLQSPDAFSGDCATDDLQAEIRLLNDHSFTVAAAAKRIAETVSDDPARSPTPIWRAFCTTSEHWPCWGILPRGRRRSRRRQTPGTSAPTSADIWRRYGVCRVPSSGRSPTIARPAARGADLQPPLGGPRGACPGGAGGRSDRRRRRRYRLELPRTDRLCRPAGNLARDLRRFSGGGRFAVGFCK